MEGDLQSSPQLEFSIDDDDTKYFSGLSTILVATIQEVKDRISQIEYLFCSQLFPNFHSRSKSLQKRLGEIRKAAEDDWKKKERSLLQQLEELNLQKQHAQQHNQCLIASLEQEKAKLSTYEQLLNTRETEEKRLWAKLESLESGEVAVLQEKLLQKTEEAAKGKELHEKLLQQLALKNGELLVAENKRSDAIARCTDITNSLQKRVAEAKKVAEDGWKKKETSLLRRIEELRHEKQHSQEENQRLTASLELEKSKLLTNEQLLNTHETEKKLLLAKLESLEKGEVAVLQKQLIQKKEEAAKGKGLQEKLLQMIALKNHELLVAENNRSDAIASYTDIANSLQERLAEARKVAEDDWKKKERSLLQQIEELRLEKQQALEQNQCLIASLEQEKAKLLTNEEFINTHETEKKLLLAKFESLGNGEVGVLQKQLMQKMEEVAKGKELQEKLLKQIELKNCELLVVVNDKTDTIAKYTDLKKSYKSLKSQYNYLLSRSGLASDNKIHTNKMFEEWDSSMIHRNIAQDLKNEDPNSPLNASKPSEQTNEISVQGKSKDDGGNILIQSSNSYSNIKLPSTSTPFHTKKPPVNLKSESSAGLKRSISNWIDTRSRQEAGGADPHDDFLDTPIENVKENLKKSPRIAVQDFPVLAPKDMEFGNSTQEINADPAAQKQHLSVSRPEDKGFKYVEPVRTKAERENLKGVECKQCKKFYDAVIPDGGDTSSHNNIRCEHHDGVSRHRYRYVPPMTPDGFWNIGFDSDM